MSRGCSVNTKLTLRLDEELIAAQDPEMEITPRVRALRGVLAGSGLDEDDYRRHLEIKHL